MSEDGVVYNLAQASFPGAVTHIWHRITAGVAKLLFSVACVFFKRTNAVRKLVLGKMHVDELSETQITSLKEALERFDKDGEGNVDMKDMGAALARGMHAWQPGKGGLGS